MQFPIFFAFFLYIVFNKVSSQICYEDLPLNTPEEFLISEIEKELQNSNSFDEKCLEFLVLRGYYKAANHLYTNHFLANAIVVKGDVHYTITTAKREIETLYNLLSSSDIKMQEIEPVFQWAQSYKNIFIQVKFAHRLDSPGCLSVKNEKVILTNETLFLTAFGIQARQPINFTLNLSFYEEIVPENSTWKLEAVGTMFFNLTKANDTLWRRLIISKNKKIAVWWHMNSIQTAEMSEFARMLDDEDEARERLEDKKRKKKKERKGEKVDKIEKKEEEKVNLKDLEEEIKNDKIALDQADSQELKTDL